MIHRLIHFALIVAMLGTLTTLPGRAYAQEDSQPALSEAEIDELVEKIIATMTVEQRVGQIFLVTFVGNDTGPNSDIARLIRDWHVGGVVLLAENDNFRNGSDTAAQVLRLNNDLQTYAFRDLNSPAVLADGSLNAAITTAGNLPGLPLLVAIEHEGDEYPYTRLIDGFTPIPNNLAIGATWQTDFARDVGIIVGRELAAVGINLLLGPSLDVLDNPRPELQGYPGSRTFGGDAFWVAKMGQAYIEGVRAGSGSGVATVAKHFPGQGSSDRRPDREVATVQKPLSALQQVELVPFRAVTEDADTITRTTDALMTSHVRYKGFQENPRQLTPPISLAPELQTIMAGFDNWRSAAGLLVSDALGVRALKRYYQAYEPARFPSRRVTQEALLAGNDLLFLSQFDRDGIWSVELANMEDAMGFFRQKYAEDPVFRARVDEALARIIKLKLRLYPQLSWAQTQRSPDNLDRVLDQDAEVVSQIARSANTLIFPGATEIADRLPSPPLPDERVLIFTDTRPYSDCQTCPSRPAIEVDALEQIAIRLYGPSASDQVNPELIDSASFEELDILLRQGEDIINIPPEQLLSQERYDELNGLINGADWIVFAMLDIDTETVPSSAAIKRFLDLRADLLRDKRLIVFAFNAPYFLSDTEIGKLTAYYSLYSKVEPFLETAVRTLFRELSPAGSSPVSVVGVNYFLNRQLEPDPERRFRLLLALPSQTGGEPEIVADGSAIIDLSPGDQITLRAGPVFDRNGNIVPDGTSVEFRFQDLQEGIELPRRQALTLDGIATTQLTIDRPGALQLSATAGDGATSDVLLLTVSGDAPASLATATPTATPTTTPSPTPTETPTPTPKHTPTPTPTPEAEPPATPISENDSVPGDTIPRVNLYIFLIALLANGIAFILHYLLSRGDRQHPAIVVRNLLISIVGGQTLYLLFALNWLPGSTGLHNILGDAAVVVLVFIGGLLPFILDPLLPHPQSLRSR